jgi:hypothetical protein
LHFGVSVNVVRRGRSQRLKGKMPGCTSVAEYVGRDSAVRHRSGCQYTWQVHIVASGCWTTHAARRPNRSATGGLACVPFGACGGRATSAQVFGGTAAVGAYVLGEVGTALSHS